jgi:hypothetical protein
VDYQLNIVSRGENNVLSLEAAKRQLDVTFIDDDVLISSMINEAVDWVENYTGRYLFPATIDLYAGNLGGPVIRLPGAPINAVTTIAVDGVAIVGFRTIPGSSYTVLPPEGQSWPFTVGGIGSSVIRYEAGYADGRVPSGIVAGIKGLLNILYDKPSGSDLKSQMDGLERALAIYRVRNL